MAALTVAWKHTLQVMPKHHGCSKVDNRTLAFIHKSV